MPWRAGDLYQSVQTDTSFTQANPFLKAEDVHSAETPLSFVQNLDRTWQRGIELVDERRNVWARGLDLSASMTYMDATIVANNSYAPTAAGASSVGKRTPMYRHGEPPRLPRGGRTHNGAIHWPGRAIQQQGLCNSGQQRHQSRHLPGFQSYLVLDARLQYKHDRHWTVAAGIANINNRKDLLLHPFPQRALFAELRYRC